MNKMIRFVQEAIQELKLSSWLTRQQMIGSTIVVVIFSMVMSLYIGLVDWVLMVVAGLFFRIG